MQNVHNWVTFGPQSCWMPPYLQTITLVNFEYHIDLQVIVTADSVGLKYSF